ncbi:MAG: extracellular solute-binding protein [Leptolyngbyaceae cyanobacterium T60_A2020_046]|nr:extracellular solute-binding protein [Leptolyngbyaceae cyanobacterium T60_A2020_046]
MLKRRNLFSLTVWACVILTTACSGTTTDTAATDADTAATGDELGGTLRLLTWEGYAPDELIAKFEEETGVDVEVTYIADNGEIISKLKATGGEGYDLASPSVDNVKLAQEQFNIYQPIDMSRIENPDVLVQSLAEKVAEYSTVDGEVYSVPAVWGTSGLIVNTAEAPEVKSYKDLCDPQFAGRVTYRSRFPTFAGAMLALGYDPFKFSLEEPENVDGWRAMMEEAYTYLVDCKSNVKTYWTSRQENIDLMAKGETYLSQGWDGTGWVLSQENPDIKFIAPVEGALGWVDTFTIPAGAKNLDAVYAFINFMYRPENAGELTKGGGFLSPVKGSTDYWPEEIKVLVEESFPESALNNIQWYAPRPAAFDEVVNEYVEKLQVAEAN